MSFKKITYPRAGQVRRDTNTTLAICLLSSYPRCSEKSTGCELVLLTLVLWFQSFA
jgi:hypothetical protein